jgi:hypothetical protein
MAVGDLLHPEETWDTSGQAVIVVEQATRWYLAQSTAPHRRSDLRPRGADAHRPRRGQKARVGYAARLLHGDRAGGDIGHLRRRNAGGVLGSLGVAATEQFLQAMFSGRSQARCCLLRRPSSRVSRSSLSPDR